LNSVLSKSEGHKSPYFSITRKDRDIVDAYKVKYMAKMTLAEHLLDVNEVALVLEGEDLEPFPNMKIENKWSSHQGTIFTLTIADDLSFSENE
jgi:hypothetical protein